MMIPPRVPRCKACTPLRTHPPSTSSSIEGRPHKISTMQVGLLTPAQCYQTLDRSSGANPVTPTTVIGPPSLNFASNTIYTIVAEGPVASLGPVVVSRPEVSVASNSTRVEVLNAAPNASEVSVWVTAPGAALSSGTPLGTFSFQGSLPPTTVSAGQYEIRVTPGGATTPVLFDSGTITLTGGADLLVAALQNKRTGTAPITLGFVDSKGNNSRILSVGTPADVRIVHDSPCCGSSMRAVTSAIRSTVVCSISRAPKDGDVIPIKAKLTVGIPLVFTITIE